MHRRLVGIASCTAIYGLSVGACGRVVADGGSGGAAGTGAASGLAGSPGEVTYSGECGTEVMSSDCEEDCPVTTDLLVRCDVEGFANTGPRVAPVPEVGGVYLVATAPEHAWFATLAAPGGDDFQTLPQGFAFNPILLTLSPNGVPALAVDQHTPEDVDWDHGVVVLEPLADSPSEEVIAAEGGDVLSFEYDAAGTRHLAYESAQDALTMVTRSRDDAATSTATWPYVFGDAPLFTADGQSLVLRQVDGEDSVSFVVDTGTETYPLSDPLDRYPGVEFFPVPPALPLGDDGPTDGFVVGIGAGGPSRVIESRAGEQLELDLGLPPRPQPSCLADHDGHTPGTCPESCEEVADGVLPASVGLAQTSDGRLWAAWVHSYIDEGQRYRDSCWSDDGSGCSCAIEVTRDDTHGEIVLAELDLEQGALREVLRLPSEDIEPFGGSGDRPLDLRAFGHDLALGVRLRATDHDYHRPVIRALRIDSLLIPKFE